MEKLQTLYEQSNATLSEIAKITGFAVSTVSRYTKGQVKDKNPEYYDPICKALLALKNNTESPIPSNVDCETKQIDVTELKEQMNRNGITKSTIAASSTSNTYISSTQKPIRRGDVWYVKNNFATGSEQAYSRPCVVVSSDKLNSVLDVYTVVYLTSQEKQPLPNHISIKTSRDSIALCEQVFSVSKSRFCNYLTHITNTEMEMIDRGIMMTFGISYKQQNVTESHDYLRLQIENRMLKEFNETLSAIAMK